MQPIREQRAQIEAGPNLRRPRASGDRAHRIVASTRFSPACRPVSAVHGLVCGFGSLLSRSRPVIVRRTEGLEVTCWASSRSTLDCDARDGCPRGALDAADRDVLARRMLDSVLAAADGARSIARVPPRCHRTTWLPPDTRCCTTRCGSELAAPRSSCRAQPRSRGASRVSSCCLPADLPRLERLTSTLSLLPGDAPRSQSHPIDAALAPTAWQRTSSSRARFLLPVRRRESRIARSRGAPPRHRARDRDAARARRRPRHAGGSARTRPRNRGRLAHPVRARSAARERRARDDRSAAGRCAEGRSPEDAARACRAPGMPGR